MRPRLIHPVPVTIEQIKTGSTVYDDDMREPVQQAARASTAVVPGQIAWGADRNYQGAAQGPQEASDGYVTFRYADLKAQGVELRREDRFARFGCQEVDVYVVKVQPLGHYADQGGASLVRAYFSDRQPSKQTRG